jgi:dienelactone hydrolase
LALVLAAVTFSSGARAAVQTREVEYKAGDTPLQGFVAWNDAKKGKQPGVLVVHEWWGHNEHARTQAKRLAEAGYVAFALDMFGKGKVTTHPKDAQAFIAEATKDPAALNARFNAALEQLKADPNVDPSKIAAIGYCFGGGVVLNQARAGADLDAVASFHGSLAATTPATPGSIKARILVLNGADDPMVKGDQVEAFKKEMAEAKAPKVEVINYPGARHGFTNPDADKAGMEGLKYDAKADKKSWAAMLKMLKQVFK